MKKIKYNKIIFKLKFIYIISTKNAMFLETLFIFLCIIGSVLFNVNDNYITDILVILILHFLTWKLAIEKYFKTIEKKRAFLIQFIEKLKNRKLKYKKLNKKKENLNSHLFIYQYFY